ncbi:carbohydrate-binding module family 48 protein [Gonapodya prolifera JEL478]|uniref:Carbohydrate-binding module family 48 protein n=1 Tax=Gonapodya prolifera (strain JEL478) TaxID=1344416 RepID=A0A139AEK6_GONPJ|nr:carbohydrate-binding module family 48 protein [Gonapodya prolifera JEL478]|eukprot:KXS15024.1 carbohydrate-binding module family 48 protein [Gonapodya prolifera JEL478]
MTSMISWLSRAINGGQNGADGDQDALPSSERGSVTAETTPAEGLSVVESLDPGKPHDPNGPSQDQAATRVGETEGSGRSQLERGADAVTPAHVQLPPLHPPSATSQTSPAPIMNPFFGAPVEYTLVPRAAPDRASMASLADSHIKPTSSTLESSFATAVTSSEPPLDSVDGASGGFTDGAISVLDNVPVIETKLSTRDFAGPSDPIAISAGFLNHVRQSGSANQDGGAMLYAALERPSGGFVAPLPLAERQASVSSNSNARPPSQLSSKLASAGLASSSFPNSETVGANTPTDVAVSPPAQGDRTPTRVVSSVSNYSVASSGSLPSRPSFARSHSPRKKKHRKRHTEQELQEIRAKPYSNTSKIVHTAGSKGLGIAPLASVGAAAAAKEKKGIIPVIITWTGGGKAVYVTGSFNNWKHKIRMAKSYEDFTAILDLPPGTHHFKFIVDDEWRCSDDLPAAPDDAGNLVNYLLLDNEYGTNLGDGLDAVGDAEFTARDSDEDEYTVEGPGGELYSSSPEETYTCEIPKSLLEPPADPPPPPPSKSSRSKSNPQPPADPYSVPPVNLPPQLTRVVLNNPVTDEDQVTATLPVPHHVTLNHLYACSIRDGVMAVAITTRYRSKFVTTVMYKPVSLGGPANPTGSESKEQT